MMYSTGDGMSQWHYCDVCGQSSPPRGLNSWLKLSVNDTVQVGHAWREGDKRVTDAFGVSIYKRTHMWSSGYDIGIVHAWGTGYTLNSHFRFNHAGYEPILGGFVFGEP